MRGCNVAVPPRCASRARALHVRRVRPGTGLRAEAVFRSGARSFMHANSFASRITRSKLRPRRVEICAALEQIPRERCARLAPRRRRWMSSTRRFEMATRRAKRKVKRAVRKAVRRKSTKKRVVRRRVKRAVRKVVRRKKRARRRVKRAVRKVVRRKATKKRVVRRRVKRAVRKAVRRVKVARAVTGMM